MVNGIGLGENQLVFNGGGCLAAQLIAKFKDGAGGTYIHTLKSRGKCWEDYLYDIIITPSNEIVFVAYENNGKRPTEIFRGTPSEFVEKYQVIRLKICGGIVGKTISPSYLCIVLFISNKKRRC